MKLLRLVAERGLLCEIGYEQPDGKTRRTDPVTVSFIHGHAHLTTEDGTDAILDPLWVTGVFPAVCATTARSAHRPGGQR